jgi:hypothetical protein
LMTPQKFILPQLLKIATMVWDAAALWWEERAVPWLRTSFREGMIPASSLLPFQKHSSVECPIKSIWVVVHERMESNG